MKTLNLSVIRQAAIAAAVSAAIAFPGIGHAGALDTIQNKVNAVSNKLNSVYSQMRTSSPLIDVIRNGKIINDLKDIMVFLNAQRADYEEFADSGIDAFSGDIANLLDGFGDIGGLMKLGKDMDDKLDKAHDLIAKLPPQFMYILHKAIGPSIAELREDIQSLAGQLEVVAGLPSNRDMLTDPEAYRDSLCPLVEERAVKVTYEIILARLKLLAIKLESINDRIPDDLTVVVNVVGGGGTTLPFPAKPVSQRLKYIGKRIVQRLENAKNIATAVCDV